MNEIVILIIGILLGGCIGITLLCCFQLNRINAYESEIHKLKQQLRQEAISRIPTDRFYSLVLNEVLEYWGQDGSSFAKKHIPFQLIESGYFEPEEQTFGEMKLT